MNISQYWVDEYADQAYKLYGDDPRAPERPSKGPKVETNPTYRGQGVKRQRRAVRSSKREML
jgi:hypothetical protein